METVMKRIMHRLRLPYFTVRGWIAFFMAGLIGGMIGSLLFGAICSVFE